VSTRFLTLEVVLKLVARQRWRVKDVGLLDSALKRPQATVFGDDAYPTLAEKVAAMTYSIAQNQALVDGNKRLALLCAHALAVINGSAIAADDEDVYQLLAHQIPGGLTDVRRIAAILRVEQSDPHSVPEQ
jgi:death-on-curing protein